MHVTVAIAFALVDVDHHPLAVDITDLELDQFASSYARRIQSHEHRAVQRIGGAVDESRHFFLTENDRQPATLFGKRDFVRQIGTLERFHIEETQSRYVLADGVGGELTLAKQVRLVFADVVLGKLLRRAMEVLNKPLHGAEVSLRSKLRVITTLEFLQHHFSLLGHGDLLVTQRYRALYLLPSLPTYA